MYPDKRRQADQRETGSGDVKKSGLTETPQRKVGRFHTGKKRWRPRGGRVGRRRNELVREGGGDGGGEGISGPA